MPKRNPGTTLKLPEGQYGPAMRALPSEGMRAFVIAMLTLGTNDHKAAARAAGYGGHSENGLGVIAHRLAHDDRIQAAIQEEARRRLNSGAIMAVNVAMDCMQGADKKLALKAAEIVMNRAGLHAMSEHKVTVENVSDKEALSRINQRLADMGFDAEGRKKFLGRAGITDVEFEEVKPEDAA